MGARPNIYVILFIVGFCGVLVLNLKFQHRQTKNLIRSKDDVINPDRESAEPISRNYPAEVNWKEALFFISDKKNEDCLQLFTNRQSAGIKDSSFSFSEYNELMNIVRATASKLPYKEHEPAPAHEKLTLTYQALAKQPWVKTVCEIGFDQGQSALAWLTAKQDLTLHSFDIGTLGKTLYMAKLVKDRYLDRFQFHFGSSDMIMPLWASKMKEQCDIVSIDGGHDYPQVLPDFMHMRKMAAKKHIIIADDIEYPGVKRTWTLLKELGIVTEQYRCHIEGIDIDFVIGQYGEFFFET